jgi:hypothetical protein
MARAKKVVRLFPTIDVVAAACAAQRINGSYVKNVYADTDNIDEYGDLVKRKTNL